MLDRVVVLVGLGHVEQLGVVGQIALEVLDGLDHAVEFALFLAQFLGALGLVPDRRVLQRGVDLVQPQCFAVVVKDTPGARRCAREGR
jgi:hypothetical protein